MQGTCEHTARGTFTPRQVISHDAIEKLLPVLSTVATLTTFMI